MGFYGNITNTSRTQFQFDRIYSSRTEMDSQKYQDNIYAGRYVLVEYDQAANLQLDTFLPISVFKPNEENPNRGTAEGVINNALTVIKVGDMRKRENPYAYTHDTSKDPSLGYPIPKNCIFYKWVNSADTVSDSDVAEFEHTVNSDNNYTINYNLDTENYGEGRGYDSTVWQKMYIDNLEKYVMIAELNTVVPTFEVSADAPTMVPIVPHFDTASTDVYYKLHYQPQWGFRLKANEQTLENEDGKKIYSIDETEYPSDLKVEHKWATYDPATGKQDIHTMEYDSAVYFNKAGFDPVVRTYYEGHDDEISILPTGQSGNLYNNHKGDASTSEQPDIQELKILLPAIGNMVSDAWDIVYGYNPDNENKRYRDIEWKFIEDEDREGDFELGGMTRDLETFSGCINTIHDLIGMIVTKEKPEFPSEENYNNGYIYLTENIIENEEGNEISRNAIYERLLKIPTYKIVDTSTFKTNYDNWLKTDFASTQEKNAAYEALFENFTSPAYYIQNENGEFKFINIRALPEYLEEIIYEDDSFSYEYVEIQGLETHLLTILGALITCRNLLGTDTPSTTDRTTVQGALNALNSIIDRFKDATPGQFTFVDEDGKLVSMNWTTKQSHNWKNFGTQSEGFREDIENRYIDLTFDFSRGDIELTHRFNEVEDTTTIADKNIEEGTGNNKGIGDTVDLYTPIVDNMGHVVGHNIETVTLPYGYKVIKVENSEVVTEPAVEINTNGQVADNTQDTLNFNASNRWIKIDNNTDDTVKLGHRLTVLESGEANKKYGLEADISVADLDNDNTFEVPVLRFDEAGHINFAETHTVVLPENYDKINVTTSSENFQKENLIGGTDALIQADTLTDTLTFKQDNKWVIITGNADDDSIAFGHYVNKFNQTENSTDFNNIDNGKVFYTQEITWDDAGHLISSNKHNFTLPDNFKNIVITNSGSGNTAINNSAANGILIADTLVDTATIDAGNRWIQLAADVDNDKVTIYHAPAGTPPSGNTTFDNAETPNYGVAFTIPEVKYDEAGHIYSIDTHTVKFPTPSLNDLTATGSSVLTGIKMDDGTLAIEQTNADVGTLKLTQYIPATGDTLTADETINSAFRKLSTRIQAHENDLNALIGGELKEKFDTLVEMSDWLDANDTEIVESINKLNTDLTKAIDDESTSRQQADNTINTTITNLTNTVSQNYTTLDEAIDKEVTDREIAVKTVSDNLSAETAAREEADIQHTKDIQNNTAAIAALEGIIGDKFDENTLFNWGHEKVEEQSEERVTNSDGSITITPITTITYVEVQKTLQEILEELRIDAGINIKGEDQIIRGESTTIPGGSSEDGGEIPLS